jgi:predicted Zn-dependent protease
MEYHNKLPPEGINITRVHPLKQFLQFAIGALVLVVVLVVILQISGSFLAKRIPFSFETALVSEMENPFGDGDTHPEMTGYLNTLAQRLSAYMSLPEGMTVTVHYDSSDVFNAFATVGGNLFFYKGLLEVIPDENTLAMVMAHEIAHVLHRDPIAAMGGSVASSIALLALTGNSGTAGSLLSNAGVLTSVQFTRKMEVEADREALQALYASYGHVHGAAELFMLFSKSRAEAAQTDAGWLERFLSTHPLDQDRINNTEQIASDEGWPLAGKATPLPQDLRRWLDAE